MSTPVKRGQVVIVDFLPTNPSAKIRPALVVQNDHDNGRMASTIVAQLTSNISRAHESTQYLIDAKHRDWTASGIRLPSVVNCSNLATVQQRHIVRALGELSPASLQEIEACLKSALELA